MARDETLLASETDRALDDVSADVVGHGGVGSGCREEKRQRQRGHRAAPQNSFLTLMSSA